MEQEEPVTPMGRLCLLPEHSHVIHCAIGLKNPIDIDSLKHEITNSIILKMPRFSCILAIDPNDGSEHWKKVQLNLEDHVIVHQPDSNPRESSMSDEDVINEYLADMAISSPMRMDIPLWEFHILHKQHCIIMRIHHALGDGTSLMSLLWSMGRPSKNEHSVIMNNMNPKNVKSMGLWDRLAYVYNTLIFGLIFVAKCLWLNDKGKVISNISGVELWPRKVATARFKISDMKTIKKAIPNATVHDVLCGVIWCGLSRYLNIQYPKELQDGVQITGMCPFNLREQPGVQDVSKDRRVAWGNRFSVILIPLRYMKKDLSPLAYVSKAKAIMQQKKHSMEARLSYNIVSLTSKLLGSKVAGFFYYNLFRNTSFLISNIPGPPEEITIDGNPVTFVRVTSSAQPHAMTMHLISYSGQAELQIQVAKEVIPDPKYLAKCFQDALLDMKDAAEGGAIH